MSKSNLALFDRIQAYTFPDIELRNGPSSYSSKIFGFSDALAKEERLFPATAERLIDEYRRYVYLATLSNIGLIAPPMLAKVRNLHRRNDAEYRINFCSACLWLTGLPKAEPLGVDLMVEHFRTRRFYIREFDALPPEDIWMVQKELVAWTI